MWLHKPDPTNLVTIVLHHSYSYCCLYNAHVHKQKKLALQAVSPLHSGGLETSHAAWIAEYSVNLHKKKQTGLLLGS